MLDAEQEPEVNEENKELHVPQICYLLLKYGVNEVLSWAQLVSFQDHIC